MRLPPMTTRRWMVLVAAVAVLLGVPLAVMRCERLSRAYQLNAAEHSARLPSLNAYADRDANAAELCRYRAAEFRDSGRSRDADYWLEQATWWDESADDSREKAAYHDQMRRKWLTASHYPWLPVDPDPPLSTWQPAQSRRQTR